MIAKWSRYWAILGLCVLGKWLGGIEIPDIPPFVESTDPADVDASGVVRITSASPVSFKGIFSSREEEAPTSIVATLYLPEGASESCPVPAMVILHGSGGVQSSRESAYGEFLADNGIAGIVLNSFESRGITGATSYGDKILCVTEADMVADAYAALQWLQRHPKIDPTRIGLMGFSYGGMATRYARDIRTMNSLAPDAHPFAVHIDYYGPCFIDLCTSETTGAPYYSFRGALDESVDLRSAADVEERLRAAGSRVGTHIYPHAAHAWEFESRQEFRDSLNLVDCQIGIDHAGEYVIDRTVRETQDGLTRHEKIWHRARILAELRGCTRGGYTMGRNINADQHARNELLEIIDHELMRGNEWRSALPITAANGMVAVSEKNAAQAGKKVLEHGGNAVDAAVTVGFVLAVTYPCAGNLGGGGFMLVHSAEKGETTAIDYREKAPAGAHRDMFLRSDGEADSNASQFSSRAVGVPGTVRGLALALEQFGTISIADALAPAIELAEKGFPVDDNLHRSLNSSWTKQGLLEDPSSAEVFYGDNGDTPVVGAMLVQPDLAWSLRQIAERGVDAFYDGEIAARIDAYMRESGGFITLKDLRDYRPVKRKPIMGDYRGYQVFSMPPPSSGGIPLVQMLNMLELYPMADWGSGSVQGMHLMAEVMKRAYADRSKHLGDADFHPVPIDTLVSRPYASNRISDFNPERAIPSSDILPGKIDLPHEGPQTTHFSVIDRWGNAVSNTYTLNFSYGCKRMVPGTGFLLNNQMDDFSAKPGVPNAYGLVGGEANAIEPGKRMLSSMSPTIVLKDGRVFLITGSPGGSTIITCILQMIVNVIDYEMNIAQATWAPRIHHQWLPDEIVLERGDFLSVRMQQLERLGHRVVERGSLGDTQSILIKDAVMTGASDPRGGGVTIGF